MQLIHTFVGRRIRPHDVDLSLLARPHIGGRTNAKQHA